jgi:hypothetical protein
MWLVKGLGRSFALPVRHSATRLGGSLALPGSRSAF